MGRLFGTDGVRGVANEKLTCELALELGRAAAMVLSDNARRRPIFAIGMDTRISSEMLACAMAAGLCSVGADVIQLGVVPTPAVPYLAGKYKADAGVMISASHNSAEFNGIKLFSGDGYKLPDELEEQIETIVLDREKTPRLSGGTDIGKVETRPSAVKDYVDHLKSTIAHLPRRHVRGRRLRQRLGLGDRPQAVHRAGRGLPHSLRHSPDGREHQRRLRLDPSGARCARYVLEQGLDIGVAFDGDADRCLCIDGRRRTRSTATSSWPSARLDMAQARQAGHATPWSGTIMTNMGFSRFCEENGHAV